MQSALFLNIFIFQEEYIGGDNKLYYSLKKTKAEILIFGASTAIHGYIPQIIEDSLGFPAIIQVGMVQVYIFQTLYLNSVLQRYLPKVVIFDMTAWEFIKEDDDFDKLSELYPYYYTNKKC